MQMLPWYCSWDFHGNSLFFNFKITYIKVIFIGWSSKKLLIKEADKGLIETVGWYCRMMIHLVVIFMCAAFFYFSHFPSHRSIPWNFICHLIFSGKRFQVTTYSQSLWDFNNKNRGCNYPREKHKYFNWWEW